jgi:hypothetical protein
MFSGAFLQKRTACFLSFGQRRKRFFLKKRSTRLLYVGGGAVYV